MSQPTLSAMLVKFEEELDVKIFDRTNKSVSPTMAGEKIIRQQMLNTITDTLKKFMPKGMLTEGIVKYGIKLSN